MDDERRRRIIAEVVMYGIGSPQRPDEFTVREFVSVAEVMGQPCGYSTALRRLHALAKEGRLEERKLPDRRVLFRPAAGKEEKE